MKSIGNICLKKYFGFTSRIRLNAWKIIFTFEEKIETILFGEVKCVVKLWNLRCDVNNESMQRNLRTRSNYSILKLKSIVH